jgi:hypothetical protein
MQPQTPRGEKGHLPTHLQYALQIGGAAQHRRLGHNYPNALGLRPGRMVH